ncbi:PAS domain S-box protein [Halodesulfurarchaeum sp. HSR-GB]|uniref:PAS domain S-box protein n=1 Tax=Halodesulfurarchaeum sp. HSR-GB TaxID=3074077 RepID=UPI00286226CA|nr:PAS domain S-box protein [Halodesulfurarchaeum sp. HSR-GB]MDR5657309.1 PAS domain S-box protein [Halodesulfurarchaeum sp. HSR-GB]
MSDAGGSNESRATIQLVVNERGDEQALTHLLGDRYEVIADETLQSADCYVVDIAELPTYSEALRERKSSADPAFLPTLLIQRPSRSIDVDTFESGADGVALVDESIQAPVGKATIERRLDNLLTRRDQSLALQSEFQTVQTKFRRLFESIRDAIVVVNTDREIVNCNQAFTDLFGYQFSEIEGQPVHQIFEKAREYQDLVAEFEGEVDDSGVVPAVSYETKSGAVFPGETRISRLRDEFGAGQGHIAIIRDVSERLERQRELKRYEAAVEGSSDMLVALDREGAVVFANEQYRNLLGVSDDIAGTHLRELLGDDIYETAKTYLQQALDGESVKYDRVQPDRNGDPRTLSVHYYPLREGQTEEITGVFASIRDISERENREQKLRKFKQAVDAAGHAVYMTDPDGYITYANAAFEDITGYSPTEAIGRNPRILKSGEMSADYYEALWNTVTEGGIWEEEVLNETKGGETYPAHQTIAPVTNRDGDIEGYVAIQTDITEQKANAEEIRQLSEVRRISSAVNQLIARMGPREDVLPQVLDSIASSDRFGCTFFAELDAGAVEFRCESGSELDRAAVGQFHTEAYVEAVTDAGVYHLKDVTTGPFQQHVEPGPSHEGYGIEIAHDDHTYGVLTVHFPPDEPASDEEIQLLIDLADDIGLYLHAKETEEERQTFAEIVQQIDDPIMLQDLDGKFEVINPAVARHADLPKEKLLGRDEFAFMEPADATEISRQKDRVLKHEAATEYEMEVSLPETGERVFSTTRYPHYDLDGELDGTIAICRDVTDLKTREEHLRVIDRLLRHNLNNDMTVILGNAEQIRTDPAADVSQLAERIIDTGTGLVELAKKERQIVEILSGSKTPEKVALSRVVTRIRRRLSDQYPNGTVVVEGTLDSAIQAVPEIEQALSELLENGLKHHDDGRPIVTVATERDGDYLIIRIKDQGPGIPKMERQIIEGDADRTSLLHGSGLGLWLVKHIVTQSNGSLEFEENEPRGSIITVRLPLWRSQGL